MNEEPTESGDQDLELSSTHIVLAILFGLIMAYLSFAYTHYSQLPSSRRTVTNFLLPFGSTQSAQKLHKQGVKQYRSGNYRKALSLFRQSLEIEPGNYKGVFLMGSALIRLDRYRSGLDLLEKVERAKPDFSRTFAKQAYVLLGLGRYSEARSAADQYLGKSGVPDANRIYAILIKLAANQLSNGDQSEVRRLVQRAKEMDLRGSSLPMKLVNVVSGEIDYPELLNQAKNAGEETEIKTWGAVRLFAEGRPEKARRLLRWVVSEGEPSRYEYDLARAILEQRNFGSID